MLLTHYVEQNLNLSYTATLQAILTSDFDIISCDLTTTFTVVTHCFVNLTFVINI